MGGSAGKEGAGWSRLRRTVDGGSKRETKCKMSGFQAASAK